MIRHLGQDGLAAYLLTKRYPIGAGDDGKPVGAGDDGVGAGDDGGYSYCFA